MPDFSLIIPTKDRRELLNRCLDGLVLQTGSHSFEVIIGNDSSAYDVDHDVRQHRLLKEVDVKVINATGKGAAAARMAAVAVSSGRYLGFLDDDAVPDVDWLEKLENYRGLLEDGNAITGRIRPFQTTLMSRARQARYDLRRATALENAGAPVDFLAGGNFAIGRQTFVALSGFDTSFKMMHDGDLLRRLNATGKQCFYVDDLCIRHTHVKKRFEPYVNAFMSAKYRVRMLRKYQIDLSLSGEVKRGVKSLVGRSTKDPWSLQSINGSLQLLHVCGLICFRLRHPFRREVASNYRGEGVQS